MNLQHIELADLIQDIQSGFASGENLDSGIAQIRMNNLDNRGHLNWDKIRRVSATPKKLKNYSLKQGDVLFNCTNSSDLVGKTCLFEGFDEPVVFSNHFFRIRTKTNRLLPAYLAKWLVAQHPTGLFKLRSKKWVNQATFAKEELFRLIIPLPHIEEQKRIAAILDKADAIRRKRQQAIELADDLLRVTFLDMFGDPLTNPKKFETAPLKEFGSVTTGNTPSRKVPEYYGNDIEWIKSDNINTPNHFLTKAEEGLSEIGKNKARIAPPNSTLVTCIAGSLDCIGNAAIANRKVAFNQQINAITPKKDTDPYFLYCLILNSKRKIQNASTNSMKGMVSKSKFENIVFFKPNFELQKQYGRIFQKHIETIYKFNRLMQCSDFLFRTLSQRAFRGEL